MTQRTTDAAYSPREADRIREQARTPGAPVVCPRCGARLSFHGPVPDEGTGKLRILVRCPTCHRNLFVTGLPT